MIKEILSFLESMDAQGVSVPEVSFRMDHGARDLLISFRGRKDGDILRNDKVLSLDAIESGRDPDGLVASQIEQVQKQTERFLTKGGRE